MYKRQLLDTPGHVDFSSEAERTLQVLDYAVLVISGTDGVQGHTRTLWGLLAAHHIPTFLFFNKMDLPGADKTALLAAARTAFGEGCIDFSFPGTPQWEEALALQSDEVMEAYLEAGALPPGAAAQLVAQRRVFPCLFGSALRCEGVRALLAALDGCTLAPACGPDFAAQVYKVSYSEKGERLTHLKVTGGTPVSYTHLDVYKRQLRTVPAWNVPMENTAGSNGSMRRAMKLSISVT